ncbi:hypothetical protein GW574_01365 [Pantoea agglomerans]|uniref:hypothetical protein n=1 Tax=Enterobacter agglomerans TaxID=549 RepID=UPI001397FFB4|nr:hypothetical protein [Pantoea agglomerans]QIA51059.1 hypothetical protein GW574_01365 [Pantoea agglomerans]
MKQVYDSISHSPYFGKSAKEILEQFKGYNFADDHGHHLELCKDFIELVQATSMIKDTKLSNDACGVVRKKTD